jgi:hypothetical protein
MRTLITWFLLSSILTPLATLRAWGGQSQGGQVTVTKDLCGASGGVNLTGGNYTASFSAGEQTAGNAPTNKEKDVPTGYYAGRLGNWQPLSVAQVQSQNIGPLVNDVQLGVPLSSQIQIKLSDQIQSPGIPKGVNITVLQDHMGNAQAVSFSYQYAYTPNGTTVLINPTSAWLGNTLYDVAISTGIQNLDGIPLAAVSHYRFMTVLDPNQENVVMQPIDAGASPASQVMHAPGTAGSPLRITLAPRSLAGYSMLLVNQSPLQSPLQVNPQVIADANQKASGSSSGYSVPVALQEIVAYNLQGQPTGALSAPAQISWPYNASGGVVNGLTQPVRTDTLSLYSLDTEHHLWVKMPASQAQGGAVFASIPNLSVFAIMGTPDGSASSVYVFPVPWRPHGPNAGKEQGQTGREQDGMTFANLPSECTIKIYTLSGDLVRTLQHSDAFGRTGLEKWDGLTAGGSHAASGVYFWEVLSSVDHKTGKLMIIR